MFAKSFTEMKVIPWKSLHTIYKYNTQRDSTDVVKCGTII